MKLVITKHAQRQFALRKGMIIKQTNMVIEADVICKHHRRGRFSEALELVSNGVRFIAIVAPWTNDPTLMAIVTVYHGSSIDQVDAHYHNKQAFSLDSRAKQNRRLSLHALAEVYNEIKEIIHVSI